MKKTITVLSLLGVVTVFGFSSCRKCQTCECYGQSTEYCVEDAGGDRAQWKSDIELAESYGCTCR